MVNCFGESGAYIHIRWDATSATDVLAIHEFIVIKQPDFAQYYASATVTGTWTKGSVDYLLGWTELSETHAKS